jgi:AraC-like DNA-binding protein/Tfp pilus assembly protein PilF
MLLTPRSTFLLLLNLTFIVQFGSAHPHPFNSDERTFTLDLPEDTAQVDFLNELSIRVLKSEPKKSFAYAQEALTLARRLGFNVGIGEAKNNLAIYHLMQGDVDIALELALDAVKIGEQLHHKSLTANGYATLGTVYHNQLDFDKALANLAHSRKINLEINDVLIASKVFNALGGIARDKGNYDSALFFYQRALSIMQEAGEDYRVPEVLNNIGIIYVRREMKSLGVEYYFKALTEAKKSDNRRSEALALGNIGATLLADKKYAEAEKYLLQALSLAKSLGIRKTISANYMALGQLKNETGKFDAAHTYLSAFYELKDSLLNAAKIKTIAELEVRYETEKKVHTIELLERDNVMQQLLRNVFIGIAVLLLMVSISIYYFRKYREHKNRQILDLEIDRLTLEHKQLSEKYKDALTMGTPKIIESVDQRLLKKAIEVVENNISDTLFGVEVMARELGMSRTNMHRKIKAVTGFAPSELIRSIRLRKAAALLLSRADSVSQISMLVGFEDHSYFSKSFKKQFGVAPSEYLESRQEPASKENSLPGLN